VSVGRQRSGVDLLARLKGVRRSGEGWTAKCPAHEDRHNSLGVRHRDGKWLIKCYAGCDWEAIVAALGISSADLFDEEKRKDPPEQPRNRATAQAAGVTLQQYAAAKALPVPFLKECGLSDGVFAGQPAVRIPYLGAGGEELAVRFRIALHGDRFRWKSGSKPFVYGLNHIGDARAAGYVVLVEGESDVHTLRHHGIPALGLPGAANWREDRDAKCLDGIDTIYIVIEPDSGGRAVRKWLAQSAIRSRAKLLELPAKDPSAMHLDDPAGFKLAWEAALLRAIPWTTVDAEERAEERDRASELCADLARTENILAELDLALGMLGLVGERRVAKLLYLALVSRLLDWPLCVALKGPSAGGKSFVVETVFALLPCRGVLRAHRDERSGVGVFARTTRAPAPCDLRGGGHGFGHRKLSHPIAAFRKTIALRDGRKNACWIGIEIN
jgi:hypothetical protein